MLIIANPTELSIPVAYISTKKVIARRILVRNDRVVSGPFQLIVAAGALKTNEEKIPRAFLNGQNAVGLAGGEGQGRAAPGVQDLDGHGSLLEVAAEAKAVAAALPEAEHPADGAGAGGERSPHALAPPASGAHIDQRPFGADGKIPQQIQDIQRPKNQKDIEHGAHLRSFSTIIPETIVMSIKAFLMRAQAVCIRYTSGYGSVSLLR